MKHFKLLKLLALGVALFTSVTQMWANDYWYRGGKNSWGATAMTVHNSGLYEYYPTNGTATSFNGEQFKIAKSTTSYDYNKNYVAKSFNGGISDIGDYGGDNCYIWSSSNVLVIVYYPNTALNTTSSPKITARTSLYTPTFYIKHPFADGSTWSWGTMTRTGTGIYTYTGNCYTAYGANVYTSKSDNNYLSPSGTSNVNNGVPAVWTYNAKSNSLSVDPAYTLTVNSDGNGTVTGSVANGIAMSTAYSITATPSSGYRFVNWTVTDGTASFGSSTTASTTVTVTGNASATIQANFEELPDGELDIVAGSNGQVKKESGSWGSSASYTGINTAQDLNIYAQANTGYHFVNWTKEGDGSIKTNAANGVYSLTARGFATVTANFAENTHDVTVYYKCGSTTIKTETTTSNVGEVTTSSVSAPAISGYTFSSWTEGSGVTTTTSTSSSPVTIKTKSSGTYSLTANYAEDLSTIWYLTGSMNSWSTTANKFTKKTGESTTSVAYTTVSLAANTTYQFGLNNGTDYYSNNNGSSEDYYIKGTVENWTFNKDLGYGVNCYMMSTLAGTYTFKIDFSGSNPLISVYYPEIYAISGDFNDWTEETNLVFDGNVGTYEVSITADETNYEFKVLDNGSWYGHSDKTFTETESNVTLSTPNNNMQLYAKVYPSGTYTFTYNKSTHKLSVTYPTAYTVTYNGNGNTDGSVPATSYHSPSSNVTLATNSGILYKTGCAFNGWNANAAGTGTHYASGGTLSSIGANTTLQAEWKTNDYTMYFYNKDSWPAVAAYMWSAVNDPEKTYPGRTMTAHQGKVYKIDYRHDVQASVVFNNNYTGSGTEYKTGDLTIAYGHSGNHWFYNDEEKNTTTGGIDHGWTQYIMVGNFPTTTVAAVVGEKLTVSPVVAWAEGVDFADISITTTRTDAGSANINAVVSGTNIIVSGTAAGTATFTVTYRYSTTTITKTLSVEIMDGITIQSKVPLTDTYWSYTNVMKIHYWGTGISTSDINMEWIKKDATYNYYQARLPLGTDSEINFLFFYDNFNDAWRQTGDLTNVTTSGCYTINHSSLTSQRTTTRDGETCTNTWQVQIVMGSGDIYTSNIVENNTDWISFFAPGDDEEQSYREGVVTLEYNGSTKATISAATFPTSGVYKAKVNTSSPFGLTDVAPYTGDYYIRTDQSDGGWDHYKDSGKHNKMTQFTRNANFANETFSYYWVNNVAKGSGDPVNIKATVANDINPVLCNFSADDNIAQETHGVNLRFGYEPTTNELVRGILRGSNENNFLNLIGSTDNIYKDSECAAADKLDETAYSSHPEYSKLQDKSNWVYEAIVYAKIDNTHQTASVYLKSYYNGIHYLLGMVKDPETGEETSTPITFPVIKTGTSYETYGLRVIYDFKTNRLFAAWAPANINIDGIMNVDADVMFLRHEQGDVAQISFNTAGGSSPDKVAGLQKAIFALEIDDDSKISGDINRELHYFVTLPFDCNVKDIFGIGGYMNYWGIQRYRGDLRAQKGWFKETPTFWEWLGTNETMEAGKGYLVSIDKAALEADDQWKTINYQEKDDDEWVDRVGSILTLYFPSTTSGFNIEPASDDDLNITYTNEPCTITRENRDVQDSNWKCIGTPGYKNITITGYSDSDPDHHADPPYFLYVFTEKYKAGDGKTYLKGKYTPTSTDGFTFKSFNSYMVQFAGTINWARYSKESTPTPVAPRRMPSEEYEVTKAEINLLSDDNELLDRTFVWLHEDATTGFDQNYDLNKMVERKANQIYSLTDKAVPFAANVLPLGTDTVQLVVNIANEGEYTFSLNVDKHQGMAPVLYDMFKSESINLMTTDYVIELEKGKYDDRFFLLFQPEAPIVTSFETTNDGGQNVRSDETIYDVLGRRVNTIYPGHLYIVNGHKRIAR